MTAISKAGILARFIGFPRAADHTRPFAISKAAVFPLAETTLTSTAIASSFAFAPKYLFTDPTVDPLALFNSCFRRCSHHYPRSPWFPNLYGRRSGADSLWY